MENATRNEFDKNHIKHLNRTYIMEQMDEKIINAIQILFEKYDLRKTDVENIWDKIHEKLRVWIDEREETWNRKSSVKRAVVRKRVSKTNSNAMSN